MRSLLAAKAAAYENKFGMSLKTRVSELLAAYPDVVEPNFLSWEGESITGADTTEKLQNLLTALNAAEALYVAPDDEELYREAEDVP